MKQATYTRDHEQRLAAARRRVKLSAALDFLGLRWRGDPKCTHRYTTSRGVEVRQIYPERES